MKRFLTIIALTFVTNIANAGWFSNDDLFVGFWKQYSSERINNNGSSGFGLSKNIPDIRDYMEIKKNNDSYIAILYSVSNTSKTEVGGYSKIEFVGRLRDKALILEMNSKKITLVVHSKDNGKIIDSIKHRRKYKVISSFEKIDKSDAMNDINAKEHNGF